MEEKPVKLVIIGAPSRHPVSTGKTSLSLCFLQDQKDEFDPAITQNYKKLMQVEGKTYSIEIQHSSGMDQFVAMRDLVYREADGFMMVYSITSKETFDEAKGLYRDLTRLKEEIPPVMVAGNKCDLERYREVSTEEGLAFAKSIDAAFYEVSGIYGTNVDLCFYELVMMVVKGREKERKKEKTNGCCTIL
eukprot:TRINITY_DN7269_c0_g1_i1.p1 TRINITY_DN7269_c0_g1~~TRINITY_DN7269_c0_g1_i1.p1  ORF type:complete len:190 (+),score=54.90 TRINITY_DN7269_c0_g1_i1:165-734(+)